MIKPTSRPNVLLANFSNERQKVNRVAQVFCGTSEATQQRNPQPKLGRIGYCKLFSIITRCFAATSEHLALYAVESFQFFVKVKSIIVL